MPNNGMTYEEALKLGGQTVSVEILDKIEPVVRAESRERGLTPDKTGYLAPVNRLQLEETRDVCSDIAVVDKLTFRIPIYQRPPEIHVWQALIEGPEMYQRRFDVELKPEGKEYVRKCIATYVSKIGWDGKGLSHLLWILNPHLRGNINHESVYFMNEPFVGNISGEIMVCEKCEKNNTPPPSDYVWSCRELQVPLGYLTSRYSLATGSVAEGIHNEKRIKELMEKVIVPGLSDLLKTNSK